MLARPALGLRSVITFLALAGCASVEGDLARTKDADNEERVEAAVSLADGIAGEDPDYLAKRAEIGAALRALLDDRSGLVRQAAVDALARTEGKNAETALIDRLRDRDRWVRFAAARHLGKVGTAAAVEPLAVALRDDENPDVRRAAAQALGALRARAAAYDLYLALSDREYDVRFFAARALAEITGEDHGLDARRWREVVPGATGR